ncbi:PREDICTED: uncharacterized protein LOC105570153 [Vollenhovia emeryi]|uniref:uncharacterized protein LOC105570153 n=1 Tax=Vollenhovia emeryi TaxID=411798 RepID=UPI0005F38760|nr:PREDICTED: uncharacterized protein LOC105570153 [Vollenhovia emeryi]
MLCNSERDRKSGCSHAGCTARGPGGTGGTRDVATLLRARGSRRPTVEAISRASSVVRDDLEVGCYHSHHRTVCQVCPVKRQGTILTGIGVNDVGESQGRADEQRTIRESSRLPSRRREAEKNSSRVQETFAT